MFPATIEKLDELRFHLSMESKVAVSRSEFINNLVIDAYSELRPPVKLRKKRK